jgi:hypothetical protein
VAQHPEPEPLEDDNHPIPRLDTYDTLVQTSNGTYLGIVIATPLRNDERSRTRLRRKFEGALGYFRSPGYIARCGAPHPKHCRLYVNIHSGSDPEMLRLVEQHCAEIAASGITPVVTFVASSEGVAANNRWRGP